MGSLLFLSFKFLPLTINQVTMLIFCHCSNYNGHNFLIVTIKKATMAKNKHCSLFISILTMFCLKSLLLDSSALRSRILSFKFSLLTFFSSSDSLPRRFLILSFFFFQLLLYITFTIFFDFTSLNIFSVPLFSFPLFRSTSLTWHGFWNRNSNLIE